MASLTTFPGDVAIPGTLTAGTFVAPNDSITNVMVASTAAISRDKLATETKKYSIELTDLFVWDAVATALPGTSATDDLGLYGGAFATGCPYVATSDLKNAGSTTRYARGMIRLPAEYVTSGTITIRAKAGMLTTVASSAATLDVECYLNNQNSLITGVDLCSTSDTTINSLTFAVKDFTITPSGIAAGDLLDVRFTVLVNDSATPTAVIAALTSLELLCEVKG